MIRLGGSKPSPREPEQPKEPKPHVPHPNAKTQLYTQWVQRGYCKHGDTCDFAHGTFDLTNSAQTRQIEKVKSAPAGAMSFRPLQAMGRTPPKPKPPAEQDAGAATAEAA